MKEIRITFRGEDFAAVSKSMIDLGVRFQVEPVERGNDVAVPARAVHPPATLRRRQGKRRSAKTVGKPGTADGASSENTMGDGAPGSGAARLRARVERNRAAAGALDARERDAEVEGSLETKKTPPPSAESKS
jgi:hypothetical protein